MGETEGLALVLGRWLDRPGWGAVRRRVGGYLAEVRAEVTEPPLLRLETPSGKLVAVVEYAEGERLFECAWRTHAQRKDIMLCGTDLTPLNPAKSVGATEVLVVVRRTTTVADLVMNNRLGELRWAIVNCSEWDARTSRTAAGRGHLKLLQWAISCACPWHPETSYFAAFSGHFELLQWAIAHGCAWDEHTSIAAAKNGHLELLQWALANGCLLDEDTRVTADFAGHTEIVEWLDARANV